LVRHKSGGRMSNTDASGAAASKAQSEVTNPAGPWQTFFAGIYFLILALVMFYILIASWPVVKDDKFRPMHLFGALCDWSPDARMFLTVVAAGAVGSLIHTLTSL